MSTDFMIGDKVIETDLKPCPFCGSTDINIDGCTVRVRCRNCYASSPLISRFLKYATSEKEAARMAWNTRKGDKDADDIAGRERRDNRTQSVL